MANTPSTPVERAKTSCLTLVLSAGEFLGPFYVRLETRIDGMAGMTRRKILPMINRCRNQLHQRHVDEENVPERIFAKHCAC